jgi:hypothetical protein
MTKMIIIAIFNACVYCTAVAQTHHEKFIEVIAEDTLCVVP